MTEPSQTRSFYVPDELYDELKQKAKKRGVAISKVAVERLSRRSFFACLGVYLFKKKRS